MSTIIIRYFLYTVVNEHFASPGAQPELSSDYCNQVLTSQFQPSSTSPHRIPESVTHTQAGYNSPPQVGVASLRPSQSGI